MFRKTVKKEGKKMSPCLSVKYPIITVGMLVLKQDGEFIKIKSFSVVHHIDNEVGARSNFQPKLTLSACFQFICGSESMYVNIYVMG